MLYSFGRPSCNFLCLRWRMFLISTTLNVQYVDVGYKQNFPWPLSFLGDAVLLVSSNCIPRRDIYVNGSRVVKTASLQLTRLLQIVRVFLHIFFSVRILRLYLPLFVLYFKMYLGWSLFTFDNEHWIRLLTLSLCLSSWQETKWWWYLVTCFYDFLMGETLVASRISQCGSGSKLIVTFKSEIRFD